MISKRTNFTMNLVFFLSAIFILLLDQITKYIINKNLPLNSSIEIIPNVLSLTHIKNSGAAFGIFPDKTKIFMVISVIAVLLIIILKIKLNIGSLLYSISLGFILGGALGNLVDRFLLGEVTDFLNFRYWPVFNVADSFVVIGSGILILVLLKGYFKKGEATKN